MPGALILKRNQFKLGGGADYHVLCDGKVVGGITLSTGIGSHGPTPWFWGIRYEFRRPGPMDHQGGCASRDEALAAFRKAWDAMEGA